MMKDNQTILSLMMISLLGGAEASQASSTATCTTCTSANGGANPIQINSVLNYGYAGMTGSQILNTTNNLQAIFGTPSPPLYSFGNTQLGWSYWNVCPSLTYDWGKAKCVCTSAGWKGANSTGALYFGWPGSYTSAVDGGNYNPTNYPSAITQSGTVTPYVISSTQIGNPTALIPQSASGTSYDAGDILYTLFGGYIGGNSSGALQTPLSVTNPILQGFWTVTGTGSYKVPLTGDCLSTDVGGSRTDHYDVNSAGAFVSSFTNPGWPASGYAMGFGTSTVSSANISLNTTPTSSNPQILFSDDGAGVSYNQAYAPLPLSGQATSPSGTTQGASGSASLAINTNSYSTTETFTLAATASQTMTQTTQQGVTSTDSTTFGVNAKVSMSNTTALKVSEGGVEGSDSLTESFEAGFNASYTDTTAVNYSTTETETTTNSSTITMQLVFNQPAPSASTATYSTNGSSSPYATQPPVTGTYDVGSCYLATITQNAGPAYLDSTFNLAMTSTNYGSVPVSINSNALQLTSTPITVLANAANYFDWWSSTYDLGSGNADSLVVSGNTVTVEGQGQLQSGVNADLELNILESSCTVSGTNVAQQKASQSPRLQSDSVRPFSQFNWIASLESIDPLNINFPHGLGYTPRHNHGFALDLEHSKEGVYYVGSKAKDLLKLGEGSDTVVAGTGDDIVYAGNGDDLVSGGDGRNTLYGQGGNDRIFSGKDADNLVGGDGDDWLIGGGGLDHFIPGDGADKLYIDSDSFVQIEDLSLKDSIVHGKFRTEGLGGALKVTRNDSGRFVLEPSKAIGFARLKDKATGKLVGMVKSQGNLFTARPAVWTDVALINISTLPRSLFAGVKVTPQGLETLAGKSRDWHFREGYRLGAAVYQFSDWNDLRKDPVQLRSWISQIAKTFGRSRLTTHEISELSIRAQSTSSAGAFLKTNFPYRGKNT